jgi:hypothetical protein
LLCSQRLHLALLCSCTCLSPLPCASPTAPISRTPHASHSLPALSPCSRALERCL